VVTAAVDIAPILSLESFESNDSHRTIKSNLVSTARLSTTSYAVLALLEQCQPATPYQLKQAAQVSIFHFWTIPHTQIYTESARLAEAGLLSEEREEGGRRRRIYRLTERGFEELERWRASPESELYELRDPGLLKLFCGADPAAVARRQLEHHEQRLALYEELATGLEGRPRGVRLALESGIGHEREYVRFWNQVLQG
jgi:DNA-binding PadR family transcriptional regulator